MSAPAEKPGRANKAARPHHHHPWWRKRSTRNLAVALVLGAVLIGGAVKFFSGGDEQPPPKQVRELKVVKLAPPPPPPPPPPPKPEKPIEEKMVEQPKMQTPEVKQEKPLDKPAPNKSAKSDEPPGPLSLDAKGTGPGDLFGLGGKPGGSAYGIGGGGDGGGGGGSKWGWYASIVQSQVESALRSNRKTRSAVMRVEIKLWADSSGRISRVQLGSSTGDAEVDAAIRDDLGALTLREPPPKDMPMPVVMRVTARKRGGSG